MEFQRAKYILIGLFDQVLQGDTASMDSFKELVYMRGLFGIRLILEQIAYTRDKEITDLAIDILERKSQDRDKYFVEFCFGCRHPLRIETGSWKEGALVVAKKRRSNYVACTLFQNGVDYINRPKKPIEAFNIYKSYINIGWIPMNKTELENTSGIVCDNRTIMNANDAQTQLCKPNMFKSIFKIGLYIFGAYIVAHGFYIIK